ncbi:hypothetical protein QNI19_19005 [Cytophagaceae bacterium DM2B3-1]|uniref:SMI1/KNR4 family protein n=1 Tax=Xanthocytophaga flava TaxID=3048013 RepID=A0ABT7CNA8_9BACT|nr:hypothetical protein [Xanthocytophaga flavus]MDJ1495036.1 hypothetical protein [Xanthocytophaga flavus]
MLYEQLPFVKRQSSMFRLESALDLELYMQGYNLAALIYKHIPDNTPWISIEDFGLYIREKYHMQGNQSWGKILYFYSRSGLDSFRKAIEELEEFINTHSMSKIQDISIPGCLPENFPIPADFHELMLQLEKDPLVVGMECINDFNAFYVGFAFSSGKTDRGAYQFEHITDPTFCNFYSKDFKEYLSKQLDISDPYPYYTLIRFRSLSPKSRTLEALFRLWKAYHPKWREKMSSFPKY